VIKISMVIILWEFHSMKILVTGADRFINSILLKPFTDGIVA
jgi:hypothetical protein